MNLQPLRMCSSRGHRRISKPSKEKQIAIDGKCIRSTIEVSSPEYALHLINAWVCQHQMVLGQYVTER